jgi:hypothetical protein
MQCAEFDLLLTDVLDGVLTGVQLDRFQAHARVCKVCGPLLAEAEAGRNWLKGLTEVEPPVSLVSNILGYLEPIWATVRQPRFAMSFGMAFFALSVGLTVAGVKPADLREISLRPAAIRHTYYETQARVVRYYENIRVVYEVESLARQVKRNVAPAEPGPARQKERKNDTTQQPEQKQERNYTQTDNRLILASAPVGPSVFDLSDHDPSNPDLPVVSVTTYRRFV